MNDLPTSANAEPRALGWRLWLALAGLLLGMYVLTAQRTVSWQDSGEFQVRCLTSDVHGTMGLARSHPLYILAGAGLACFGRQNLPFLLNAFSGLGMSIAAATLAAALTRLGVRRALAIGVAGLLGAAHTAWWLATIAEVYTWSLAGMSIEVYLLIRLLQKPTALRLAGLTFVAGLGLCIHNFALLPLPVYAVVAVWLAAARRLRPVALAAGLGAWVAGAGLYLWLAAQLAIQTGDVGLAIRSALVGDFHTQVVNVAGVSKHLLVNVALSGMNFVNVLLPLAAVGLWRLRRQVGGPTAGAIWALTAVEAAFFVRYPVPDQFTFILPTLWMLALLAGVGAERLARRSGGWRKAVFAGVIVSVIAQPTLFVLAATAAERSGAVPDARYPYRSESRYWLVPWKQNERSADRFTREALDLLSAGASVSLSDTPRFALQAANAARPEPLDLQWVESLRTAPETADWLASHGPDLYVLQPPDDWSGPAERVGPLWRLSLGSSRRAY